MPSDWCALSVKKSAELLRVLRLVWLFYRVIPVVPLRSGERALGRSIHAGVGGVLDEAENFRAGNAVLSKQVVVLMAQVREAQG